MQKRKKRVTLDEQYVKLITQQIVKGRYGSVSEAIRAELRLAEENGRPSSLYCNHAS